MQLGLEIQTKPLSYLALAQIVPSQGNKMVPRPQGHKSTGPALGATTAPWTPTGHPQNPEVLRILFKVRVGTDIVDLGV